MFSSNIMRRKVQQKSYYQSKMKNKIKLKQKAYYESKKKNYKL